MSEFRVAIPAGISSDALFFDTQPGATFTNVPGGSVFAATRRWTSGAYAGLYVRYESNLGDITYDVFGNLQAGTLSSMTLLGGDGVTVLATLTAINGSAANTTKAAILSLPTAYFYGKSGGDYLSASNVDSVLVDSVLPSGIYAQDAGNDTLLGGLGNDSIFSGGGVDVIDGGGGFNTIDFERNASNLSFSISLANPSALHVLADGSTFRNMQAGTIATGNGNDSIAGGAFDDYLISGAGNDTLDGGIGIDTVQGDAGNDTLLSLAGNTGEGFYGGGVGTDLLVLDRTGAATPVNVILTNLVTHSGTIQEVGVSWSFLDIERFNLKGGSNFDSLTGAEFDDTLDGGLGADFMQAAAGDDRLVSGVGNSFEGNGTFLSVNGGSGLDTLVLQRDGPFGVAVSIVAGFGYSAVVFDAGGQWEANNVERLEFSGGAGADTVQGGIYGDSLNGGAGDDRLTGGAGADTLIGGAGIDTADYSSEGGAAGVYVDLSNGFAQDSYGTYDTLSGIEVVRGTDNLRAGALSDVMLGDNNANSFYGYGGQDYILGNGGADYINVGAGANNIGLGGTGNDRLVGNLDVDFLYGGDGSDYITGSGGADWLIGGDYSGGAITGADTVFGEAGNDVLSVGDRGGSFALADGGIGNDTIYGGALANDLIEGGQGSDYLYGNTGSDTYHFGFGDLVSGDIDTVFTFNAGDHLLFDNSYTGHIAVIAGTNAGVSGVYLADTGSTWLAWLPYQNVAQVTGAIVFT